MGPVAGEILGQGSPSNQGFAGRPSLTAEMLPAVSLPIFSSVHSPHRKTSMRSACSRDTGSIVIGIRVGVLSESSSLGTIGLYVTKCRHHFAGSHVVISMSVLGCSQLVQLVLRTHAWMSSRLSG